MATAASELWTLAKGRTTTGTGGGRFGVGWVNRFSSHEGGMLSNQPAATLASSISGRLEMESTGN